MKKHVKNWRNANRLNWQNIHQLCCKLVLPLLLWGAVAVSIADGQCSCTGGGYNIGIDPTSQTNILSSGLPAGGVTGACITINGQLKIGSTYIFDNCIITMNDNAEILLDNNVDDVTITNSTIQGCQTLWKGISLIENAHLNLENNTVRDAINAVTMVSHTSLRAVNNTFSQNYVGLYVPYNAFGNTIFFTGGKSGFSGNTFVGSSNLLPPFSSQKPFAGIRFYNVENRLIGNGINGSIQNTFDGLVYGIIDYEGHLNTYSGCIMQNMTSQLGAGIDIQANNATVTVRNCTMTNVRIGVRARNNLQKIDIHHNSIGYTFRGVEVDEQNCREIFVTNNNFSGNSSSFNTGVQILKATNGNYFIDVSQNVFSPSGAAIAADNVNGKLRIQSNIVNLSNPIGAPGMIQTNLASGPTLIEGNTISPNAASGNANIGLNLINSQNAQVTANIITGNAGFNGSNFATAINAGFSTNHLYCCNNVDNWWAGNWFQGICTDTRLKNTIYGHHNTGLYLWNAQVTPQPNHGNTWAEPNINTVWDAVYSGNAANITYSEITTKLPLIPNGYTKIQVPFGASPMDWFQFTGNDPSCQDWTNCGETAFEFQENPNEFDELTPTDLDALNSPTSNDDIANVLHWESQRYLYQKLVNNPTLVNWNTSVATFYNDAQNGLIGKFYAVEKGIRGLNTPSSSLSTSYNSLLDDLEAIGIAINEIDIQLESANEAQTTTLLAEREDLLEQVEQRLGQLDEVKGQIASEKTGRIAQLLSDNAAIVPVASYQGYQKTAFEIYLQTVAADNTSFSTSQQASLSDISSKCPSTDGVGVYWARYLRQYYEPEWVSSLDDCGLLSLRSQEATAEGRQLSGISVFPNPASTILYLTMGEVTRETVSIAVFDVFGKNVLNKELNLGDESADIDVSGLTPGIYFCTVKDGNTILHTQKLSIAR